MGQALSPPKPVTESEAQSVLSYNCSVNALADYIIHRDVKKIVVMVGAGVSVSAGIPDFRSPKTGLYSRLQKYGLAKPEMMFDIEFFRRNPLPFFDLAKELYPSNFNPTPTHFFIKLLSEKGILRRCYSQNIDTLERLAGIPSDEMVEAHGSFSAAHCTECNQEYSQEYFRDSIFTTYSPGSSPDPAVPQCLCSTGTCRGAVKPDIVFFGENLPKRYFDLRDEDLPSADLLIVLGTSLKVTPFANTMHLCNPLAPRLLVNMERVGEVNWTSSGNGFLFDSVKNYRDVELLGPCDDSIGALCRRLGWWDDWLALMRKHGDSLSPGSRKDAWQEVLAQLVSDPHVASLERIRETFDKNFSLSFPDVVYPAVEGHLEAAVEAALRGAAISSYGCCVTEFKSEAEVLHEDREDEDEQEEESTPIRRTKLYNVTVALPDDWGTYAGVWTIHAGTCPPGRRIADIQFSVPGYTTDQLESTDSRFTVWRTSKPFRNQSPFEVWIRNEEGRIVRFSSAEC